MRAEQLKKLAEVEERLVDLFIDEARDSGWPGMSTKEDRGDRYWHKKNALATLTLVGRIQVVIKDARTTGRIDTERETSIEDEAERLEKLGVTMLRKHTRAVAKSKAAG